MSALGASRLQDPRRDLSMFDPRPARATPSYEQRGEPLDPLLPPVISDPPRRRRVSGALARGGVPRHAAPRLVDDRRLGRASAPRSRARLTTRGYAAVLALLVGGIALCSAITVGHGDRSSSVEPTQVVARGGESVEGLAERSAQGRDVRTVAESIRAANGLSVGELPQAGEILLVPGS